MMDIEPYLNYGEALLGQSNDNPPEKVETDSQLLLRKAISLEVPMGGGNVLRNGMLCELL